MLHGRGGGAALTVQAWQARDSAGGCNSADCTVPPRPSSVTDAGRGTDASVALAVAVSGGTTTDSVGASPATSNTVPADESHSCGRFTVVDSAPRVDVAAPVSPDAGPFGRSQATITATSVARMQDERRDIMMEGNLDLRNLSSMRRTLHRSLAVDLGARSALATAQD
jgi:hypothetical protein